MYENSILFKHWLNSDSGKFNLTANYFLWPVGTDTSIIEHTVDLSFLKRLPLVTNSQLIIGSNAQVQSSGAMWWYIVEWEFMTQMLLPVTSFRKKRSWVASMSQVKRPARLVRRQNGERLCQLTSYTEPRKGEAQSRFVLISCGNYLSFDSHLCLFTMPPPVCVCVHRTSHTQHLLDGGNKLWPAVCFTIGSECFTSTPQWWVKVPTNTPTKRYLRKWIFSFCRGSKRGKE